MILGTAIFLSAAFVTLRAAEQAGREPARATVASQPGQSDAVSSAHPPPSAPEESATITDDPTTAPDPAQSADHNISFPTDI
jgi:hypothetical protein